MRVAQLLPVLAMALGLTGCSPALDWREVRTPGAATQALMPCRPSVQQRQLTLAGAPVVLTLQVCSAGERTWGLASADVGDPARVAAALDELLTASARNMGAAAAAGDAFQPPGSTPQPRSRRLQQSGKLPDGRAVALDSAVFSHGTWVFQASVVGELADAGAAATFFDSLRVRP